jgi:hypothetical protein
MQRYKNLDGNSGVRAYEAAKTAITVEFNNGQAYLYNYASTGRQNIEAMKALAASGKGLSTFISQHVHDAYARRLR